ncbi:hypothetical protein ACA910_012299 [Epithemia clementina (nom. ined.)]
MSNEKCSKLSKRLTTGKNKAWKRRVLRGELAKGAGGAICRHRPRLGRRGADLILNRKGFIAGGNPKKMKKRNKARNSNAQHKEKDASLAVESQESTTILTTSTTNDNDTEE